MANIYYVYIYLDSRKPGTFTYDDLSFDHEPFYVGKGKGKRDTDHLRERELSDRINMFKNGKIKKILDLGMVPIIIRLKENLSDEESLQLEIDTIAKIGRGNHGNGPLTNLTDGGNGSAGRIFSDKTKALMSAQRKGKKQTPAQYAANCSRPPMSEEHRRKISESQKGIRRMTDEQYRALGEKNRGRKHSDESRALMSAQRKGKKQTPAQYAATLAKAEKAKKNCISYDELKKWIKSIHKEHHNARMLVVYLRSNNPPRIPKSPYTYYTKQGSWVSWNDLFGR